MNFFAGFKGAKRQNFIELLTVFIPKSLAYSKWDGKDFKSGTTSERIDLVKIHLWDESLL